MTRTVHGQIISMYVIALSQPDDSHLHGERVLFNRESLRFGIIRVSSNSSSREAQDLSGLWYFSHRKLNFRATIQE